jgi:hypothetical protein
LRGFSLVLWASAAAGCTGDLGRPAPNLWSDVIAPEAGFWAATARGEAASPFALTDDELQLRDRAWRFVMPAHERSVFAGIVSDLAHSRILPVQAQSNDIAAYHASLIGGSWNSQASRYARMAEDANADRLLIGPFRGNAMRVVAADRVRMRAVEGAALVPPEKQGPAFARVVENEGLILWVCERVGFRIESYRYALSNLVVETPSREAIRAERALMALEAEAGPMCKLPLVGLFGQGRAAPPVAPGGDGPPVVYKG